MAHCKSYIFSWTKIPHVSIQNVLCMRNCQCYYLNYPLICFAFVCFFNGRYSIRSGIYNNAVVNQPHCSFYWQDIISYTCTINKTIKFILTFYLFFNLFGDIQPVLKYKIHLPHVCLKKANNNQAD